jgi:hypothetical protein
MLRVNGSARRLRLDSRVTLLDALREHLDLVGTKNGCDQGGGACTVSVDGKKGVNVHLRPMFGAKARVFGPIEMEQLWNRGGATASKRSALRRRENGLISLPPAATGCRVKW